jgi:hypothetical protein
MRLSSVLRCAGLTLALALSALSMTLAARAVAARYPQMPAQTRLQGVLIDRMCSAEAETRIVPGPRLEGGIIVAYTHTRQCALKPACRKSGYGIFTYEGSFVPFDQAGNQKTLAFFRQAGKDEDYRVEVRGHLEHSTGGDVMSVESIELLP